MSDLNKNFFGKKKIQVSLLPFPSNYAECHSAMMIHDMIIVGDGDHFGGAAWANHPDGYQGDTTGIATAKNLGRRIGEVARMMQI